MDVFYEVACIIRYISPIIIYISPFSLRNRPNLLRLFTEGNEEGKQEGRPYVLNAICPTSLLALLIGGVLEAIGDVSLCFELETVLAKQTSGPVSKEEH